MKAHKSILEARQNKDLNGIWTSDPNYHRFTANNREDALEAQWHMVACGVPYQAFKALRHREDGKYVVTVAKEKLEPPNISREPLSLTELTDKVDECLVTFRYSAVALMLSNQSTSEGLRMAIEDRMEEIIVGLLNIEYMLKETL